MTRWMVYGANGYTGRLIVDVAKRRGLEPILAGRNQQEIEALAQDTGFDARVFTLDRVADNLDDVAAVLLAAGPFVDTSAPVVDACLQRGCHYLDITGEIGVFEAIAFRGDEATQRGVALLPGVGFDVVPSDCLAATLAAHMPEAVRLELAIGEGELSRGTLKTMVRHLAEGGRVRQNGELIRVPLAFDAKEIPFHDKTRYAVSIPWGDVFTAYYSTGIGNIRVYAATPRKRVRSLRRSRLLLPLLGLRPVQALAARRIDKRVYGPNEETRRAAHAQLWGAVWNEGGNVLEATLTTCEGYTLTAEAAVESTLRLVNSELSGFLTPSKAFGADYICQFEGSELRIGAAEASAPGKSA